MKLSLIKKQLFLLLFITSSISQAQSLYFPPLTGNAWDTISPSTLGWCPNKIDALLNYLESTNSKAFIILKDGKIVIEKYFGTFTKDSTWYWASAGKTLTAFTVGIAQQENYLSINDSTSKYLGNGWSVCPANKEKLITIKNQLTMTSGLNDDVPDFACTIDTCLQYLSNAGTRWAYHNGPYTILDEVIQSATGQTLNAYVTTKIKNKTGMTGTYIVSDYNNVFYSKPRSMARFGLLMLNKGNWNGNPILTDATYFDQMVNTSQNLNLSYGYLCWLNGKSSYMTPTLQTVFPGSLNPSAPNDVIAALGKNGQLINICPSQNLVFIRMGNPSGTGYISLSYNDTIWQKINDLTCAPTGLDTTQLYPLKIYPNPAQQHVMVSLPHSYFKVSIFNLEGILLFEQKNINSKIEINISKFIKGIYTVHVSTDTQFYTQKLILTN